MIVLSHSTFCGCSAPVREYEDWADARRAAARLLRRLRRYHVVSRLASNTWEATDRDDAVMASDSAGIVSLSERFRYECRECGQRYDDRDELAACCRLDDDGEGE